MNGYSNFQHTLANIWFFPCSKQDIKKLRKLQIFKSITENIQKAVTKRIIFINKETAFSF